MKHIKTFLLLFVGSLLFVALLYGCVTALNKLSELIGTNPAGIVILTCMCIVATVVFSLMRRGSDYTSPEK